MVVLNARGERVSYTWFARLNQMVCPSLRVFRLSKF